MSNDSKNKDKILRGRSVGEAMDIWAKQIAIGFALWLIDADHYRAGANEWLPYAKQGQEKGSKKTTEELYSLYLESIK